jgi:hypothetical protein
MEDPLRSAIAVIVGCVEADFDKEFCRRIKKSG